MSRWEERSLINSLGKRKTVTVCAVGIGVAKPVLAVCAVEAKSSAAPSIAKALGRMPGGRMDWTSSAGLP